MGSDVSGRRQAMRLRMEGWGGETFYTVHVCECVCLCVHVCTCVCVHVYLEFRNGNSVDLMA